MDAQQQTRNRFLLRNPENADFNQYWYSRDTIEAMVGEVAEHGCEGTAFLSTPSLYFSLEQGLRAKCKVFDLDSKWAKDPGFVLYDFNHPDKLPQHLQHTFQMVVIDPPFITREVWQKYARGAAFLLREGGRVLASTIHENASMLEELLPGTCPVKFKPSIPNLVYQYRLFANYPSARLSRRNPEIPLDEGEEEGEEE